MPGAPITHVSDTALWVAMYRAQETERADALFRDPYARTLAGERGAEIVKRMDRRRGWDWPHIVRTALFDEIIERCVAQGADAVLNLAAGLDARAWRMDLPASLAWYEVDYPDMLAFNRERLATEQPRCALRWEPADLASASERRALVARVGAAHRRVLVVSEGLLVYLGTEGVAALADDLHAQASCHWWVFDLHSPRSLRMIRRRTRGRMEPGKAEFLFGPAEGTGFLGPHGWKEVEFRGIFAEAVRLGRLPWYVQPFRLLPYLMPAKRKREFGRFVGVALMERT